MVDIPSATTTLAGLSDSSSAIFSEFLSPALIVLGIFIGTGIVALAIRLVGGLVNKVLGIEED